MQVILQPTNGGAFAQYANFVLLRGETVAQQAAIENVNLAGYSLKMQIATQVSESPSPILLTTQNGGLIITSTAASGSNFTINIPSSITAAVDTGVYNYDIFMVGPNGVETGLFAGFFTFQANETPVP